MSSISAASSKVMDDTKLQKYKTVMCQRMLRSGTCRYALQCDFAHNKIELRRNVQQHWYYGIMCKKDGCEDNDCRFAHNDFELMYHPHVFKTQLCQYATMSRGVCMKKHYCPYAHGQHELRHPPFEKEAGAEQPEPTNPSLFFSAFSEENHDGKSSEGRNSASSTSGSGSTPSNPVSAFSNAAASGNDQETQNFRKTTDLLKIQVLDLVDQIANVHFARAQEQSRNSNYPPNLPLAALAELDNKRFVELPPDVLDEMERQANQLLEAVSAAKMQQHQEQQADQDQAEASMSTMALVE